ncbi:MAG: carbohydrate-binding module family 20 domain-containing protein [Myxococcales bacterium]
MPDRIGPKKPATVTPAQPKPPKSPAKPANTVKEPKKPSDTFDAGRKAPVALGAIQTVFTPGDAAQRMELAALDEVIAARKADPKTYTDKTNPYRIEYAVYNMTDPEVIARLTEAAKAGVKVQVLIDSDQLHPSKWWNTLREDLTKAGFTYSPTNKGLSAEQLQNTQLMGIDLPGLFHFKARYFAYPDPATGKLKETLLSGSHNPQTSAHKNDESLHKINDEHIVKAYREAITSIRDGKPVKNTWDASSPLNVLFTAPTATGPKAIDQIFKLVDQEKELIFLSVFSLRNLVGPDKAKLVDRLAAAQARGVKVLVVTDRKQSDGVDVEGNRLPDMTDDNTEDLLKKAGIPTWEVINDAGPHTAMHLKAGLFGLSDMKVVTDTGNWTYSGLGSSASNYTKNAESMLFIESGKLDQNETGERYLGAFLRVLRKYGNQDQSAPEVEALLAELQKHPAWPKVKVSFDVVARTHMGQDVYITGNTEALGRWGDGGPGIKLETDPSTYPNWRKAEVELPLGAKLEYKVVKRSPDGRVEWEPGENAVLIVDPTTTARTNAMSVSDAFNGDR